MTRTKISVASVGMVEPFETSELPSKPNTDKISSEDVKRSNCLLSALRPLLFSMSITGLFDVWKFLEYGQGKPVTKRIFLKLYRIMLLVLFGFNCIRYFLAYHSFDFGSELLSTVLIHAWFILCSTSAVSCYRITENPENLITFFSLWRKYWNMVTEVDSSVKQACSWRQIRKYTNVCTVIGWFAIFGNIGFCSYTLISGAAFKNMIEPFPRSHGLFPVIASMYLVIVLYLTCAWSFSTGLMITLTLSMYQEFKQFALRLEKVTQKSVAEVKENMEAMRKQHNALCNMLDKADDILKHQVGLCLVVHVFLILLLIYNICWYEIVRTDIGVLVSHLFWLTATSTILTALMATCCLLNIQAHEPAKFIYNLSMRDITAEFSTQVNVFLHRLNGPPMGLTAWSLFVVDSQVVVSVAGMLATYFVVLLQFQQASTSTTASGNSTAT
ncbi:uncharacterized protein LOC132556264 [Ylistrum balloti]|uniref:uncharacterized protein LOC132556264 n=1 Tax=Ylistrum balloti TaxID=509963 RepID=UPI002905A254|nr:uncharacterized protein LOC132556264 [Ylistrum balloti]